MNDQDRTSKANRTKAATWERLTSEPMAESFVRFILDIENAGYHAYLHESRIPTNWAFCTELGCLLGSRDPSAAGTAAMYDALAFELSHDWCRRYGVTYGYYKRFRSWAIYRHAAEMHARRAADRAFTDTDRAALAAWLVP